MYCTIILYKITIILHNNGLHNTFNNIAQFSEGQVQFTDIGDCLMFTEELTTRTWAEIVDWKASSNLCTKASCNSYLA